MEVETNYRIEIGTINHKKAIALVNPMSGQTGGHSFPMDCVISSITDNYLEIQATIGDSYVECSGKISWQVIEFY